MKYLIRQQKITDASGTEYKVPLAAIALMYRLEPADIVVYASAECNAMSRKDFLNLIESGEKEMKNFIPVSEDKELDARITANSSHVDFITQPIAVRTVEQKLRVLCGYVEDGSDTVVKIYQDDATRSWCVAVGSTTSIEASMVGAINAAYEKLGGIDGPG